MVQSATGLDAFFAQDVQDLKGKDRKAAGQSTRLWHDV